MTDIALHWDDTHADIALSDNTDLATDDGLKTAVILSLFTDRRAHDDDALPDGSSDRRGWWADAWPNVDGDQIGSRLWLLCREKQRQAVLERAKEYAEEALAWLLADGIAARVVASAEVLRRGVLGLRVRIERPDGRELESRFQYVWEGV